jgi:uncharacterized protein with HEPN domain
MRSEKLFLLDIIAAADRILAFTAGKSQEEFRVDEMMGGAVMYQVTIIGEAVSNLSEGLKQRYPAIPWRDIKGFRNVVVHNYFGIEHEEAWGTVIDDVPKLRGQIQEILRIEFPEPDDTLES